jgi:MoxR-like ATPase
VVLTSNRTRELHDALKRRCLYQWIDYPDRAREREIVAARCPGASDLIAERVCRAVEQLRREDLYKPPGVGETLAWVEALEAMGPDTALEDTLGVVLKIREDIQHVRDVDALHGI